MTLSASASSLHNAVQAKCMIPMYPPTPSYGQTVLASLRRCLWLRLTWKMVQRTDPLSSLTSQHMLLDLHFFRMPIAWETLEEDPDFFAVDNGFALNPRTAPCGLPRTDCISRILPYYLNSTNGLRARRSTTIRSSAMSHTTYHVFEAPIHSEFFML